MKAVKTAPDNSSSIAELLTIALHQPQPPDQLVIALPPKPQ